MLPTYPKTLENLSPQKLQRYAELHEHMYQESIRLNRTPIPDELKDPQEWMNYCKWRNDNWRRLCRESSPKVVEMLMKGEAAQTSCLLNEEPSRSAT